MNDEPKFNPADEIAVLNSRIEELRVRFLDLAAQVEKSDDSLREMHKNLKIRMVLLEEKLNR